MSELGKEIKRVEVEWGSDGIPFPEYKSLPLALKPTQPKEYNSDP